MEEVYEEVHVDLLAKLLAAIAGDRPSLQKQHITVLPEQALIWLDDANQIADPALRDWARRELLRIVAVGAAK